MQLCAVERPQMGPSGRRSRATSLRTIEGAAIIRSERVAVQDIEDFRHGLDSDTLAMIDRLREIVGVSHSSLIERIKWNAPSFGVGGDDLITLGMERKGGVRLVLHRGANPQPDGDFSFDDADRLEKWPAADRGVMVCKDVAAIDRVRSQLTLLCSRWIEKFSKDI